VAMEADEPIRCPILHLPAKTRVNNNKLIHPQQFILKKQRIYKLFFKFEILKNKKVLFFTIA